jgi:hypothetical protein
MAGNVVRDASPSRLVSCSPSQAEDAVRHVPMQEMATTAP